MTTSAGPASGMQEAGAQAAGFTYENYVRFSRLVEKRFGLCFPDKRRADLERGVLQAFAASTCETLDSFYHLLLDSGDSAVHLERLVNALTICESHFFRDAAQFSALEQYVLPQLIERRRALRTLRIWSAGCASGEEAYSIAILLREMLPDINDWSITILGTDVNSQALDRARRAVYGEWSFREDQAHHLRSLYFHKEEASYALAPEVRRMVTFARLNLMQDSYPSYATNTTLMDLILCRNVTIYFPAEVTQTVINRFYEAQSEGGWLVVGHSEPSLQVYRRYQTRNFPGAILYQRISQPTLINERAKIVDFDPDGAKFYSGAALLNDSAAFASVPVPHPSPKIETPPVKAQSTAVGKQTGGDTLSGDPLAAARELLVIGKSEQARDLLLAYGREHPHQPHVAALLGKAYANLGDWSNAEKWCREAIQQDRLSWSPYYILALVLQHQGRLDQAVEAMKKVVYIDRKNVLGHFGLADLYHTCSQGPQALKALDNAYHLLEGCQDSDVIPESGGITAGRLRSVIVNQQQRWNAELA